MIRSRLSYVRYYPRILTLLLPACAYYIAVTMGLGFNLFFPRSAPSGSPSYWAIMLLTTIVWAITADLDEFDRYNFRHTFKAGITGWAQVNGWRGDTSIAKRVEYDRYYLSNGSLTFDLQIITLTCLRLFHRKNAP